MKLGETVRCDSHEKCEVDFNPIIIKLAKARKPWEDMNGI
jgi:hypothetical protein